MKYNSKFTRIVGVGLTVAMLASTVLTAVPVFADVSAVTATPNNTGISQNASWDIRFTANNAIMDGTLGGNITLTFPSGFTVNNSAANVTSVTVAGSAGWISATNFTTPVMTVTTINSTAATRQILISLAAGDVIGSGSQVRVILPVGVVTNPSTGGSYTVSVATSNDTTAVASSAVVITLPNIGPLPGMIQAKNSNGDLLYQALQSDLTAAITTPGASRIELGAGTFNATNVASVNGQTIIGVGTAGTVIITAGPTATSVFNVTAVNVTLQNLTFQGNVAGTSDLLTITGNNTTVRNCTFNGGVNQIAAAFTASSNRTTIADSILNVTGNVSTGVLTSVRLTTNSTFNVDNGGAGIISSIGGLSVTGATFSGASGLGTGIMLTGNGTSTITNSSFNNLANNAISYSGLTDNSSQANSLSISGSNFTGNGNATATSSSTDGVITAAGSGSLILVNNTISNSAAAAYSVYVSGANVTARFNSITGNTLNVKRTSGTADFANNWWGSANAPGASSISGTVTTTPYLTGVTNSGSTVFSTSNLSTGAPGVALLPAGVEVTSANSTTGAALTVNTISAGRYAANPQTTAPAGTPIAYYDVYVAGASIESGSTITVKFYNAGITADTKVYFTSPTTGGWVAATNQAVSADNRFVVVTITGSSSPSIADMDGTPFVLTNVVTAPIAPTLVGPTGTANPTGLGFSWNPVVGATSYNFQLSTSPTFATTVSNQTGLTSTVFGGLALSANTTYFWRVQAVNAGGASAWTSGTFTTATAGAGAGGTVTLPPITNNVTVPAPVVNVAPAQVTVQPPNVTVNPPQVTIQPPPPAQVTVNPPQVTVQPPPPANVQVNVPETTQAVPSYILWTIILIGAVLVIALIVLIVRTRRVA